MDNRENPRVSTNRYPRYNEASGGQQVIRGSRAIKSVRDELSCGEETIKLIDQAAVNFFTRDNLIPDEDYDKSPDHDMAGGYPYAAVKHVDNEEAVLPGLSAQEELESLAPGGRRDKWQEVHSHMARDGKSVLLGLLDDSYYILDPVTEKAITPAFRALHRMYDDHAVVSLHSFTDQCSYVISAAKSLNESTMHVDLPEAYDEYPSFLLGSQISITRQHQEASLVPVKADNGGDVGLLASSNTFGFESRFGAAAAYGRAVFSDVIMRIAEYASFNRTAFRDLRKPDTVMTLPYIDSPRISAELQFRTDSEETTSIRLADYSLNGFTLTKGADDRVILTSEDLRHTVQDADESYRQSINKAGELLAIYFDRLYKEQGEMTSEKLNELRRKIGRGGIASYFAKREMKKLMQPPRRT